MFLARGINRALRHRASSVRLRGVSREDHRPDRLFKLQTNEFGVRPASLAGTLLFVALAPLSGVVLGGESTDGKYRALSVSDEFSSAEFSRAVAVPGLHTSLDVNRDGVINVLDVAFSRRGQHRVMQPTDVGATIPAHATGTEQIIPQPGVLYAEPGASVQILFHLRFNTTPVLGYSLDVDINKIGDARGEVLADAAATNFFDSRNLFLAAGLTLDPAFSMVIAQPDGGVFVNAITADSSVTVAIDGVNDILAEVVFDVAHDACGEFELSLGPASALSDAQALPIVFTVDTVRLIIAGTEECPIPAASTWGLISFALLVLAAGHLVILRRLRVQTASGAGFSRSHGSSV